MSLASPHGSAAEPQTKRTINSDMTASGCLSSEPGHATVIVVVAIWLNNNN